MRRQHAQMYTPHPEDSAATPEARAGLKLEFSQLTDTGVVRDHNEDSIGIAADAGNGWLFVLADGVGGHERGEVASQMAVDCLTKEFHKKRHGEPAAGLLQNLVQKANLQIYEAATGSAPGGKSMATTVVAAMLRFDRLTVAHAGDSRCYLVRRGRARVITRDHTLPQEQLRMGLISVRDAAAAQNSNVLSRSLGSDMVVNVEIDEEQIYAGDVIMLCSDGLHNSVGEADLEQALHKGRALEQAAAQLIGLARERDGKDNISVQLIRIESVERVGLYRGRHYPLR